MYDQIGEFQPTPEEEEALEDFRKKYVIMTKNIIMDIC